MWRLVEQLADIDQLMFEPTVLSIRLLRNVRTERGLFRAWARKVLNQHTLAYSLQCLAGQSRLLEAQYAPYALMRSREAVEAVLAQLESLEAVAFDLSVDLASLDDADRAAGGVAGNRAKGGAGFDFSDMKDRALKAVASARQELKSASERAVAAAAAAATPSGLHVTVSNCGVARLNGRYGYQSDKGSAADTSGRFLHARGFYIVKGGDDTIASVVGPPKASAPAESDGDAAEAEVDAAAATGGDGAGGTTDGGDGVDAAAENGDDAAAGGGGGGDDDAGGEDAGESAEAAASTATDGGSSPKEGGVGEVGGDAADADGGESAEAAPDGEPAAASGEAPKEGEEGEAGEAGEAADTPTAAPSSPTPSAAVAPEVKDRWLLVDPELRCVHYYAPASESSSMPPPDGWMLHESSSAAVLPVPVIAVSLPSSGAPKPAAAATTAAPSTADGSSQEAPARRAAPTAAGDDSGGRGARMPNGGGAVHRASTPSSAGAGDAQQETGWGSAVVAVRADADADVALRPSTATGKAAGKSHAGLQARRKRLLKKKEKQRAKKAAAAKAAADAKAASEERGSGSTRDAAPGTPARRAHHGSAVDVAPDEQAAARVAAEASPATLAAAAAPRRKIESGALDAEAASAAAAVVAEIDGADLDADAIVAGFSDDDDEVPGLSKSALAGIVEAFDEETALAALDAISDDDGQHSDAGAGGAGDAPGEAADGGGDGDGDGADAARDRDEFDKFATDRAQLRSAIRKRGVGLRRGPSPRARAIPEHATPSVDDDLMVGSLPPDMFLGGADRGLRAAPDAALLGTSAGGGLMLPSERTERRRASSAALSEPMPDPSEVTTAELLGAKSPSADAEADAGADLGESWTAAAATRARSGDGDAGGAAHGAVGDAEAAGDAGAAMQSSTAEGGADGGGHSAGGTSPPAPPATSGAAETERPAQGKAQLFDPALVDADHFGVDGRGHDGDDHAGSGATSPNASTATSGEASERRLLGRDEMLRVEEEEDAEASLENRFLLREVLARVTGAELATDEDGSKFVTYTIEVTAEEQLRSPKGGDSTGRRSRGDSRGSGSVLSARSGGAADDISTSLRARFAGASGPLLFVPSAVHGHAPSRVFRYSVQHRYSEFRRLHHALQDEWPEAALPELPGQSLTRFFDPKLVMERRDALDVYLSRLVAMCTKPALVYDGGDGASGKFPDLSRSRSLAGFLKAVPSAGAVGVSDTRRRARRESSVMVVRSRSSAGSVGLRGPRRGQSVMAPRGVGLFNGADSVDSASTPGRAASHSGGDAAVLDGAGGAGGGAAGSLGGGSGGGARRRGSGSVLSTGSGSTPTLPAAAKRWVPTTPAGEGTPDRQPTPSPAFRPKNLSEAVNQSLVYTSDEGVVDPYVLAAKGSADAATVAALRDAVIAASTRTGMRLDLSMTAAGVPRLGRGAAPALVAGFDVHDVPHEAQLASQGHRCAGCGRRIRKEFFRPGFRECFYTHGLYCRDCHSGKRATIPARTLWFWDMEEYPVCDRAASFLQSIHDKPILCASAVNPLLYRYCPAVAHQRLLRVQLCRMREFILTCPQREQLVTLFGDTPYYMEDSEMLSVADVLATARGELVRTLTRLVETLGLHITQQCRSCRARGFYCEFCRADHPERPPVFAFEIVAAVQCRGCNAFFHRDCYVAAKCPKCRRLEAREAAAAVDGDGDDSPRPAAGSSGDEASVGAAAGAAPALPTIAERGRAAAVRRTTATNGSSPLFSPEVSAHEAAKRARQEAHRKRLADAAAARDTPKKAPLRRHSDGSGHSGDSDGGSADAAESGDEVGELLSTTSAAKLRLQRRATTGGTGLQRSTSAMSGVRVASGRGARGLAGGRLRGEAGSDDESPRSAEVDVTGSELGGELSWGEPRPSPTRRRPAQGGRPTGAGAGAGATPGAGGRGAVMTRGPPSRSASMMVGKAKARSMRAEIVDGM